jgi:hypothetical protein
MQPVDWHSVQIQITGPRVDPAALTKEFGVEPSQHSPNGAGVGGGAWILDTKDQVSGNRLVDHLNWLRSRLRGHRSRLSALGEAGLAHLYVRGAPEAWDFAGITQDLALELGLHFEFVVFRKGPIDIRVDETRYADE